MDDISRERRSGSTPEQGGSKCETLRQHVADERSTAVDAGVVDESRLGEAAVGAEDGLEAALETEPVEVPRVIVDAGDADRDRRDEDAPEVDVSADTEAPADTETPAAPEPVPAEAADEDEAPALSDPDEIARVSFGLLLTQRDGLSPMRLAEVCGTTQKNIRAGLERLSAMLEHDGLPLVVQRSGERIKLLTRPEIYPYVQRLKGIKRKTQLSSAALETLAVIAYRQPVIRAEIESIRGVKAGPMLRSLLEGKLVRVVGRADVPGRPLQYGTTQEFLERFGLESLKELPSVQEFKAL